MHKKIKVTISLNQGKKIVSAEKFLSADKTVIVDDFGLTERSLMYERSKLDLSKDK